MRIMEIYEALWAYGGINLFCRGSGFTKQILEGVFGDFFFILPHILHVLRITTLTGVKNMRLMKQYEERVIKGFHLPCIETGIRSRPKYEAVMKIHEDDLHVFGGLRVGGVE